LNSMERREARYQRRVAKRREKHNTRMKTADNFEAVFSYANLYRAYKCSRRGVSWKSSVQKYITNAPLNIYQTRKKLLSGKYKSPGFFEFDICERGKLRHIRSTMISERVVQRCLCDNALLPALVPSFVYDNGASLQDKGYDFAMDRLEQHLHEHYREHGQNGYILLFDFRKFFDNVSHAIVKQALHKHFTDDKILALSECFIDAFGDIGLGLGSQISQVLALSSADRLDHAMKEVFRIRGYGRYMDDGHLIHESKEYLQTCLDGIKAICKALEINLNEKKTQLVKLSHGFTWLKARIFLTPTGKVIRKICKSSITRERRKLKRLHKLFIVGKISFEDIRTSWQSWKGYALKFDAWNTVQTMGKLYDRLFIEEGFLNGLHQSV